MSFIYGRLLVSKELRVVSFMRRCARACNFQRKMLDPVHFECVQDKQRDFFFLTFLKEKFLALKKKSRID